MNELNSNIKQSPAYSIDQLPPFKGIIFDMDGTLLESTQADYKAWEKILFNMVSNYLLRIICLY